MVINKESLCESCKFGDIDERRCRPMCNVWIACVHFLGGVTISDCEAYVLAQNNSAQKEE